MNNGEREKVKNFISFNYILLEIFKYRLVHYHAPTFFGRKLSMNKPKRYVILALTIVLIVLSAGVAASKANTYKQTTIEKDTQLAVQKNITPNADISQGSLLSREGEERFFIASAEKQGQSVIGKKTPLLDHDLQNNIQHKKFPNVLNKDKTFVMYMKYQFLKDIFSISLDEFIWDAEAHRYLYTLNENYEFTSHNIAFARLDDLEIYFDFDIPYTISYSYQIKTYPLQFAPFGDFMVCRVTCSPLFVENGLYKATETFNEESIYESFDDFDGQVIKQALNWISGDLIKSLAYFKVNSEEYADDEYVYQRGLNLLSAIIGDGKTPTGGASLGAYAQTLGFDILGEMDTFWIDSGWQGTVGDRYTSNQQFRIEPR